MKKRRTRLLSENTQESIAILKERFISKNSGPITVFSIQLKDKIIEVDINKKFEHLNIGDTVLLKYSKVDPSVGVVINPCYMRKYKEICK